MQTEIELLYTKYLQVFTMTENLKSNFKEGEDIYLVMFLMLFFFTLHYRLITILKYHSLERHSRTAQGRRSRKTKSSKA